MKFYPCADLPIFWSLRFTRGHIRKNKMNISSRFDLGDQVTAMNGQIQGEVDGFFYDRAKTLHVSVKWLDEEGALRNQYFIQSELKSTS